MTNIIDRGFDLALSLLGEIPSVPFSLRFFAGRGVLSVPAGTDVSPSISVDSIRVDEKWISIYFSL